MRNQMTPQMMADARLLPSCAETGLSYTLVDQSAAATTNLPAFHSQIVALPQSAALCPFFAACGTENKPA